MIAASQGDYAHFPIPCCFRSSVYRGAIVTPNDFRRIALSLPEAVEGSHFGVADFRVGKRIFATLAFEAEGYGVLLLTPDQQAGMVEDAPEIFSPVHGGWGRLGATRVHLAKVPTDILEDALRTAWLRKAPKHLLKQTPFGGGLNHECAEVKKPAVRRSAVRKSAIRKSTATESKPAGSKKRKSKSRIR